MKYLRLVLTIFGGILVVSFGPACEMQSAATTVPGYAEKKAERAELADEPLEANPAPPRIIDP